MGGLRAVAVVEEASAVAWAAAVVAALRRLGLRCHLVTGDGWVTARAISARLGIVDVSAEVGPAVGGEAVCSGRPLLRARTQPLALAYPCLQRCLRHHKYCVRRRCCLPARLSM